MENIKISRPKIGVMVNDLTASHLSWALIKSANNLAKKGYCDVCVFFDGKNPPCINIEVASLPIIHSVGFNGVLVATSLNTASKLAKLPANSIKLFYCWDLEWQRLSPQHKHFVHLMKIYQNNSYRLVARTVEQARIISRTWNVNVNDVVEDADVESLFKIGYMNEE